MKMNLTYMLFLFMLIMSTFICISSNSWLGAWIGLEMNLLSFIPMLNDNKNLLSNESSLKYFLVQVFASILLLFFISLNFLFKNFFSMMYFNEIYLILLNSSLFLKMGAAPFHFWFPSMMEGMNWMNNFILMTWQKINPMICLSYCINMNYFYLISLFSIMIGALGGLNNSSLQKIITYSSITHIGWMIIALMNNEMNFWFYFFIYFIISLIITMNFNFLKLFYMNQMLSNSMNYITKITLMMMFLSMGGLPPFLGFFPKWIIIESMINMNMIFYSIIMILCTLLMLYIYLRFAFSILIMNNFQMSWKIYMKLNFSYLFMNFLSLIFPFLFLFMI
uniref:NADH-ubiquinone oxidoreductase chain 2 n=1 Tax=Ctenocephalides felis felis TaxID=986163 RepID=A0A8F4WF29_CTEFE|nr:NADH dehydrogenase subunit 2 [Ctenocephalides felis felis]QXG83131.1 NADH dehydrogenase subunit 2 [Ctenocephalides felis felis]